VFLFEQQDEQDFRFLFFNWSLSFHTPLKMGVMKMIGFVEE